MSWNIEFVAPTKETAIKALMHPLAQSSRGLPIAVREQVIVMVEMLSDQDPRAFVYVKTHGHLTGERATGAANMTIDVHLVPSYVIPTDAA